MGLTEVLKLRFFSPRMHLGNAPIAFPYPTFYSAGAGYRYILSFEGNFSPLQRSRAKLYSMLNTVRYHHGITNLTHPFKSSALFFSALTIIIPFTVSYYFTWRNKLCIFILFNLNQIK